MCAHRGFRSSTRGGSVGQDANATRNIPHAVRTTEAVTASMLKRTFVRQLNLVVVLGEALHVATAFLFMYFRKCTC